MADSENNRTLPTITRRKMLSATTAYLSALIGSNIPDASYTVSDQEDVAPENVLALWRDWYDAHQEVKTLCHRQQRLETQVLKSAGGFPVLKLEIPGEDRPVVVRTYQQIDAWFPGRAMAKARKTATTELSAKLEKWNAADEKFGYSRICHAENQIALVEEALARSLWEAPAHTISDVIAKLHSIVETEDPGHHFKERPWPQLRIILADLVHIEHPT